MYKKEDLKFLNMDTVSLNKNKIFMIENTLSIEEKVKFIDELENGIATYLLDLMKKWEKEKDSLPKNEYGSIKTVSKKSWIKRNDARKIIGLTTDINLGYYYLFGTEYIKISLVCPTTKHGYNLLYSGDNIVKQWFHDLCVKLYNEEKKYFKSINPVYIKIAKIKEEASSCNTIFDSQKLNDIIYNNDENVTEEELDIYLEAYRKIKNYTKNITNDVKNQVANLYKTI